ncbi:MAG TPA: twin-arginine translocase subunit TatC [Candidatus Tectomicrobia bacterium]|nr:twin-arginine translocase subunit TatC [Candidatus Tectomicrobia bacterium]
MSPAHDTMPFLEHLGELRTRIVRSLVAVLVAVPIGFWASPHVLDFLSRPIKASGHALVFVTVTEAFWTQMKIALFLALFVAAPAILWQVWRFVEPGLHPHEKRYAVPFVVVGSLMFIAGGAFSLLVVTPNAVTFLLSYARPGLQPMISIGGYIDFLLKFTLAFGAVFEVPIAMTLAARLGLVTPQALARNRKYAVLGAFIAAAVLTPTPDIVNQSLMAGPIILLYEVGILSARLFRRRAVAPQPASEPA